MRQPVVPVGRFAPIFGFPIVSPVRCNNSSLQFHGIHVEEVVLPDCAEPNVFSVVLPVRLGTSPFFSFPGNPVSDDKVFVKCWEYDVGRLPVAADIDGRRRR